MPKTSAATYANAGYTYREKYQITRAAGCRSREETGREWIRVTQLLKRYPEKIKKIKLIPKVTESEIKN
ncbi:hypothetical protein [Clostridium sp. AM58-1XD]|uniref:hypothetical protein n=1 Tax=Clostridium sp. AM58-1XD TaxID=2292307 RepID=UPI0011C0E159|nr:hypothetical protein [Clostridium sp. AM58-1XD]